MERARFRRILVVGTALVAILGFTALSIYEKSRVPDPLFHSLGKAYPFQGTNNAKIELVMIEDFRCEGCRHFSLEILSEIQSNYVENGIAKYTIIPVAFLEGSKLLANAALAVFEQTPAQFFPFVQTLFQEFKEYESDSRVKKKLYALVAQLNGIDDAQFRYCMEKGCYYDAIDENLARARELMGNDFGTPSLFVNGILTPSHSYEAIKKRIEAILEQEI